MNEINHVSSIEDRIKKQKLNNVLDSLNDLIDCSYNSKTCQDYGQLCYEGSLTLGQTIEGTKQPQRQNVPIVTTSNVYIGDISSNGSMIVKNNFCLSANCTSCACKQANVCVRTNTSCPHYTPTNECYNSTYCWTECNNTAHVEGVNCHIICCDFAYILGADVRNYNNEFVGNIVNGFRSQDDQLQVRATLYNGLLFVNTEWFTVGCFDINKEDIVLNGETVATCGKRVLDSVWPGQFWVANSAETIDAAMCIRTTKCIDICYSKKQLENIKIEESYV